MKKRESGSAEGQLSISSGEEDHQTTTEVFLMPEVQHLIHSSWQRYSLCWLFLIISIFPTGLKKDMTGFISLTLNTET